MSEKKFNKSRLNLNNIEKNNEENILISKMIKDDKDLDKILSAICKLVFQDIIDVGFLIKLKKGDKDFFCLLTNAHLINKDKIETNKQIILYYNIKRDKIIINLNGSERYIKYNKDLDFSIIE